MIFAGSRTLCPAPGFLLIESFDLFALAATTMVVQVLEQFQKCCSRNYSWFVMLNEVKNPLGQRRHSQRNFTGFFATLRMTWGSENG
jgi:hypothetical protein